MNIRIMVSAALMIFLAGCGYQTDEEVLASAVENYSSIAGKYSAILNSKDNKEVVKNCARFGRDYRTNSFWYSANLDIAEIAPLHRALYVISDDHQEINRTMHKLERRMLTNTAIYQKFENLLDNLNYALKIVRDTGNYLEEARVLEQRRLEQEQLEETRRQRVAMESIAYRTAQPVVVTETIVTSKPCCSPSEHHQEELAEIVVE